MAAWADEDRACAALAQALTARRMLARLLVRSGPARMNMAQIYAERFGVGAVLPEHLLRALVNRRTLAGLVRRSRSAAAAIVRDAIGRSLQASRQEAQAASQASQLARERIALHPLHAPSWRDVSFAASAAATNGLRLAALADAAWDVPLWLARHLARCFAGSGAANGAAHDWAKQVVRGWRPPGSDEALLEDAARIRASGLFDAAAYANRCGLADDEVAASIHYALIGDALGIPPSDGFDPAYYADRNPDIVARGEARLLHYVQHGRREGRHPTPPAPVRTNWANFDASRANVVLAVHETSRTGAPVLGWNIGCHLAKSCNVFTVLLGGGALTDAFADFSAELHGPFQKHETHPADLNHALRRLLDGRDFAYAIVNSCESRMAIAACFDRLIPVVLLMHEFGSYVYDRASLRAAFDMASEVVFPAQSVADSSLEVHPPLRARAPRILPQGMSVLPGPLPPPGAPSPATLSPETPSLAALPPGLSRLAAAHAAGTFIVLGAGTVGFRKGVDLFLAVAMAVCRDAGGRPAHFLWVGGGYQPDEDMAYSVYLREQMERSGLQDTVTLLDELPDLQPAYAVADCFLLSSRLDPMPNVGIDAAHRGIPIVCFDGASGTADVLRANPVTATGVVPHLDTAAAAQAILALIADDAARARVAAATRALAASAFDMARYCETLHGLGAAASERLRPLREDAALLIASEDFDCDLFLGPETPHETRDQTIRRAVARTALPDAPPSRRSAAAFDPQEWKQAHGHRTGAPLAAFIRAGRPAGPWAVPVLRPDGDPAPARATAGLRAVLHVHLTDPVRARDCLERIRANRHELDLLVSTDTAAMATRWRAALGPPDTGTVFVTGKGGPAPLDRVLIALQDATWDDWAVIGHLHDGGPADAPAAVDLQWQALLGGPHPMLHRILRAFSEEPALGLVFATAPALAAPGADGAEPALGMFWGRRAALDGIARRAAAVPLGAALRAVCVANGFTVAMAHAPGIIA